MFGGLLYISRTISDRRPVLVLDSEGLFYRPHGKAIVPWRDILAVEEADDGGPSSVICSILTRRSGPPVSIELLQLSPAACSRGKQRGSPGDLGGVGGGMRARRRAGRGRLRDEYPDRRHGHE